MEVREFGLANQKKVMLLPGNLMSWKQFKDVIPLLTDSFHVIAVSPDGFDGTGETTFTTAEAMAEKLEAYITENLEGAIDLVFGESFGSATAGMLFHRQNVRVGSLIMSGPQYLDLGILNPLIKGLIPRNQYRFIREMKKAEKMPLLLRLYMGGNQETLKKQFENVPENISLTSLQNCMNEALRLYETIDTFEPDYRAHVAVWYGSEEPNMKTAIEKLTKAYPALYLRRFDGYSHGEILTHPEVMAKEISSFLA